MLAAAAHVWAGAPRANDIYQKAWCEVLFNQFHDILDGSCVTASRESAMARYQKALAAASVSAGNAMRTIADAIDTTGFGFAADPMEVSSGAGVGFHAPCGFPCTERGVGSNRIFHLFNPTAYDFDGVVSLSVWDWNEDADKARFSDDQGVTIPSMLLAGDTLYWRHYYKTFALRVRIPAFGYATYTLTPSLDETDPPYRHNWSTRVDQFPEGNLVLQNQHIRATFCRTTAQLLSLIDLNTGEELCGKMPTGFFSLIDEDTNKGMSSWRVGSYMQRENLNQSCHVHFKSCSMQGIRKWISYELTFRDGSVLRVKIVLDDNSRSLVYETAVDFRLRGSAGKSIPRLDFTLPIGYRTERCRCGVPFGMLDRVAADHDIPCLSYTAALPAEAGKSMLALMSDCKYGYRFWDNTLSLGLIRGSYEPDPTPEIEPTSFRLAISVLPTEDEMTLIRERSFFLNPPIYCSARPGSGYLPTSGQLLQVKGNVSVSSVKTPEDGDGLVLRLVNEAAMASDCSLTLCRPIAAAALTDANERMLQALAVSNGNTLTLCVPAKSVRTLMITF
jgi:alpha-mannosidase